MAILVVAFALVGCGQKTIEPEPPELDLPPLPREFRGIWIPTVSNICWPSAPGLSVAQQKAELIALLDQSASLNLNAVVLQVRSMCDAFYPSEIEPWSAYLTGVEGQAPSPEYDPLAFAVEEAHRRGLELHAWFNPYRARSLNAKIKSAPDHITERRPDLVRRYGRYLWLDPGEPEVQAHTLSVLLDVVERYDIDAVHFDDYFYPYPETDASGKYLEFPDNESWERFGKDSGLSRYDWRRRNVDQFIQRVYQEIRDKKPQLKFGISPFGIWRPNNPSTIQGLDAYAMLYADARKWLREGWCDYLAPQLYWPVDHPPTSFPVLLDWWCSENPKDRHIFPGMNAIKTTSDWEVSEIVRQVELTRAQSKAEGQILWSAAALAAVPELVQELADRSFSEPALAPAFPWLAEGAAVAPSLVASLDESGSLVLSFSTVENEPPWKWAIQSLESGEWQTQILLGFEASFTFARKPEAIALFAIDRAGNASLPAILETVQ
ncbi:family 10 glycosylhydrolase [Pelagicoccus enzymogenes]|uniref:glycoside hydrolase family 10 protein n=1 Tax=Pelagicoccus enzymogenes TaxID=2773457 RepID=UPI00280E97A8|nr:family 10 glycosylhydrolase [Pelagicoccus enzymogenes]MDQ8197457.1 family 10 glycosylhydrolase [Pelagicoccus enzymogenes]